ncbi:2-dehydro-3-deoxy-6-phosphogalactonate aldolase [Paenarthrobacter sp. CM16]|uniref:2-dehydro-3-deoxy-6-phosphogalactonate aldolase n=1 Tax=Paenarthrobacter sp. CM16 TaxID=2738447 RepID=UPI0015560CF5|nr:2-dehydro-3-deoxy-6-phosphogalactonate aldolase [Paenarthrobacter sp. CM16]NQD86889.1 2-dehydro-3-deoxy-6-phosphogalactonate aldolase [Paenarthrobacter sp. CM16]
MSRTPTGLIAILRGLTPPESEAIGQALYAAGFRALEVPVNSPHPYESIRRLRENLPEDCIIGAGTVLRTSDVELARAAGSNLVVSPNTNQEVIKATLAAGMLSYPGAATPTEALAAIEAGATSLKLFPAETIGVSGMKAWRAVLPGDIEMLPVGGIDTENLPVWAHAGAGGAGIGSTLYRPGRSAGEVGTRAAQLIAAWAAAKDQVPCASNFP